MDRSRFMEFNPVRKRTTREAVIATVQEYIVSNRLKPGDALPTEHDLASRLEVSRNILREALQYFRTLGIIESKPRRGAVIKRLAPKNPFQGYLPYLGGDSRLRRQIEETRMVIELGIIPLLLEKIDERQVEELAALAGQLETSDSEERLSLEIEFHTLLLSISRNEILLSLKSLVVDFFETNRSPAAQTFSVERRARIVREHLDIVSALRKRDAASLSSAIRAHYSV